VKKNLILIDGHALAFRSFFALERTGMQTTDHTPTWAVYGFFKAIFDILKKMKPDCIATTFDVGRQTFRVEKYSQYKANRETMPDTLRVQMGLIMKGLEAFNIPIYTKEGFEADDVIGTIVKKARELGHNSYILTGDQDAFQLVDKEGFVKVIIPSKGQLVEYDWDKVYEKLGVYPNQVVDYKALRGDTSDNIPGIRGIGEKTATSLLEVYPSLELIYENIDNISAKALRERLINGRESAFLSQFLARINENVELDFDFQSTCLEIPNTQSVKSFFEELQFYSFVKNLDVLLKPFACNIPANFATEFSSSGGNIQSANTSQSQLSLGLDLPKKPQIQFERKIVDTEIDFLNFLDDLYSCEVVSLNIEATSQHIFEAKIVGISFGYMKNEKLLTAYIPLFHDGRNSMDTNFILEKLRPIFESTDVKKVLQNAKYEFGILDNYGIELKGIIFDTMLASYIKDSSRKHALKIQAAEHLGFFILDTEDLVGKGVRAKTMNQADVGAVANFACDEAAAVYLLWEFYQKNLNENELKLINEIEFPLMFILYKMEKNGVSIDVLYLKEFESEITQRISEVEKEIFEISGGKFNLNSPKQTADVLFNVLKITPKKKNQRGYSTNAKVLEELEADYPIAAKILEFRHLAKLKTTYVDVLPELICKKDKRIHTSYNQAATATGRLSSSDPNLQNIPVRTELGSRIRRAFVPKNNEESVIVSADYSQIELRLLAHFSEDKTLTGAFMNDEDIHTLTASRIYNVTPDDVTNKMRYSAKAVNFGIIYGQTRWGLASQLKITTDEAQNFIDRYFETYPDIRTYMQNTLISAHHDGFVETIFNRRRYLSAELSSKNAKIREFAERAAINAPLQGSAADLIKLAMINLDKKLKGFKSKMIIQVHDELVLEVLKDELDEILKIIKEEMELGQPLKVPLRVDFAIGQNWMESK